MTDLIHTEYKPDYVSPPGATLLDALEERGMSQAGLARRIGRTPQMVNRVIKGEDPITTETALLLERVLGIPASFWFNRESRYREYLAREKQEEQLESHLAWARQFPYAEMAKRGWVPRTRVRRDKLTNLLSFFGVASPYAWAEVYASQEAAFRKSSKDNASYEALAVWLRKGELLGREVECDAYSPDRFKKALKEIRKLTVKSASDIGNELRQICASCGVVVIFIRLLPKTHVWGSTRWLTPRKALIQLSLRYKFDDHFWFTFFHECCHVLKHSKRDVIVEWNDAEGELELEANRFAENFLIRDDRYRSLIDSGRYREEAVVREFARAVGIAPGIVVGRLQHDGLVQQTHLNRLRKELDWLDEAA